MNKLVMDLIEIKRLSEEHEKENWDFRRFLKWCEHSRKEIDETVQRLYREISAEIDCTKCGNCCKEIHPIVRDQDIERLSDAPGMTLGEYKKLHLKKIEGGEGYEFKVKPCPLLKENSCTCYSVRPSDCRSYPHLNKNDFVLRLISVIENCSLCPIVYNVYESLKGKLWC